MQNKSLKIACIGNMNNFMFSLMRHLNCRGYAADLIMVGDEDHFQTESDTFEIEKYKDLIKKVDWLDKDILSFNQKEVRNFLKPHDFTNCAGVVLGYLYYANVIVDLFIPYGGDFFVVPFDFDLNNGSKYIRDVSKCMATSQTKGINASMSILWDIANSAFEKIIDKFKISKKIINNSSPFIYTNEFNPESVKEFYVQSQSIKIIEGLKQKYDLLIFNHIRQCWIDPPDQFGYKGNAKIFNAFC